MNRVLSDAEVFHNPRGTMSRFLLSLLALMAFFTCALATPDVTTGEVTVAHGWVRQPDGTRRDISGMKLPFTAYKIQVKDFTQSFASRLNPVAQFENLIRGRQGGSGGVNVWNPTPVADSTVYDSNAGVYGMIESNPSSLDDLELTGGAVGKPWSQLGFAFDDARQAFAPFIMRWRVWLNNVDHPAPANDFDNEIADFGVIWTNNTIGSSSYVVIDVSQAGIVAPQSSIFMAEQFRELQLNGEGDFLPDVSVVFTGTNSPPLVGSSLDQFWYDWDPLDGNYENTEIDHFDGSYADIVYTIKVSSTGTSTTLLPNSMNVVKGTYLYGTYDSLQYTADGDLVKTRPVVSRTTITPTTILDIEANCPTASPLSISYQGLAYTSFAPVDMQVELWDFVNNNWVLVDDKTVGTTPTQIGATYGGAIPLSNFVSNSTPKKVRARLTVREIGSLSRTQYYFFDMFNWVITRP